MSSRAKIIAGNWKMYKTIGETVQFVNGLPPLVTNSQAKIYLAVPFTSLKAAREQAGNSGIHIGAQNMHDCAEGPYTGETSARMIKDAGAEFVILGHSERRRLFHESNAFINRKIKRALIDGLQPLLCIGETLEEHQDGRAEEVLKTQLKECLADLKGDQLTRLIIAYEPVWAIGTDKTATPEIAQKMHQYCRNWLSNEYGNELAEKTPILYGGSAKPENAKALMEPPDIDGLLIGGASLSLDSFSKIVNDVRP